MSQTPISALDLFRLDGKVALVTGAAGEIGAATVKLMIARGARVVAVDRDKQALGACPRNSGIRWRRGRESDSACS